MSDDVKDSENADTLVAGAASTMVLPSGGVDPATVRQDVTSIRGFDERYVDEGLVGEGGMGRVLLCRDRQIGRRVAMKVLRPELAGDGSASARFVREARVQGQLEHPAIVPVYDLGADPDDGIFFTMKRIRGRTLAEVIDALRTGDGDTVREFSRHRLLTLFTNICLAIDYAHERRVLHRDLKPANIMLGDYGELYVLDWGLAKIKGEAEEPAAPPSARVELQPAHETAAGAITGTPGYMSPEQLSGDPDAMGPQSDVYALGAILFEILTLKELHEGHTTAQLFASTLQGVDARPSVRAPESETPPELEAICVRATELVAEDRYATAREIHNTVEAYLEGERDTETRKKLAKAHATRASLLSEQACAPGSALVQRRAAMRAIGQTLALDPDNEQAMDLFVEILSTPPDEVPPEVEVELRRSELEQNRHTAKLGVLVFVGVFIFVPFVLWIGIRDAGFLWIFCALAAACAATSFSSLRSLRPPTWVIVIVMLLSNLMFGTTAALYGPLLLLPPVIVALTMSFTVHLQGTYRWLTIAMGGATMVVPLVLEFVGFLPSSYSFTDEGILVHLNAIALPEGPTLAFLGAVHLTAVVAGSLVVGKMKDSLKNAEKSLYLYTWHLREWVPSTARRLANPLRERVASVAEHPQGPDVG